MVRSVRQVLKQSSRFAYRSMRLRMEAFREDGFPCLKRGLTAAEVARERRKLHL